MRVDFDETVVPLLFVHDVFPQGTNHAILEEAVFNRKHFSESELIAGDERRQDPEVRNNLVADYDRVYQGNRARSALDNAIQKHLFKNDAFRLLLRSWRYPMNNLWLTSSYDTMVSRYGDEGQRYGWHIDAVESHLRWFTMIYFFFREPQAFEGGCVEFSNAPLLESEIQGAHARTRTLAPENNMLVIFSANVPHRVLPTMSPDRFEDGRFSANIFVGKS